jgi:hypothetical protein
VTASGGEFETPHLDDAEVTAHQPPLGEPPWPPTGSVVT